MCIYEVSNVQLLVAFYANQIFSYKMERHAAAAAELFVFTCWMISRWENYVRREN